MQDHLCQELNCQHKCWIAHKDKICPASEWASFSQCHAFSSLIAPLNTSAIPPPLQQKPTQLPLAPSPWVSFISHQNTASPHCLTPCWLQTTGREVAVGDRAEPRATAVLLPASPACRRPAMRQEAGKSQGLCAAHKCTAGAWLCVCTCMLCLLSDSRLLLN